MRKRLIQFVVSVAVLAAASVSAELPASAQSRPVGSVDTYCQAFRNEIDNRSVVLNLDEVATPLSRGFAAIDDLRVGVTRVLANAPDAIAPLYRLSLGSLGSMRIAWKVLKTARNESRKSNARIAFSNTQAAFGEQASQLRAHVAGVCGAEAQARAVGAESTPASVPTLPSPTIAPVAAPVPTPAPSGNAATWLAMVNQARSQARSCGGTAFAAAPPLVWDARMEDAARVQSTYQDRISTMTHTGDGGSNAGQRMAASGFNWSRWGENVGWNYPDASAMLVGWLNSPGHCTNIMNPEFTHIGWARVGTYDTMDLARPR
jgi:uncharacterized protein YkwD